jgi:hypothetical protein
MIVKNIFIVMAHECKTIVKVFQRYKRTSLFNYTDVKFYGEGPRKKKISLKWKIVEFVLELTHQLG